MIADNIAIAKNEVKQLKLAKAAELAEVVEASEEESASAGEEAALFPAATVVIFTFMPWSQCPKVPQAKYLVPALFNLTTSFPPFLESSALPRSQFL